MLFSVIFCFLFASGYGYPDAKTVAEKSVSPSVTTNLGTIQGSTMKTRLGKIIFAFRGIPYAKPPVGDLRFKPPEPVEKWNGSVDASKDGFACPQDTDDSTSEDCLILNVYSTTLPKGDKNPKRPVVVYFHAGGFYSGSGQSIWAGPHYLLDKELVFVTPNYRLGSLGFLSTGDKEAPGNNGLKDQVEALRWVKQNIEAFGGDPDLVTIVGYSAGSASITLHMVSPMSRGLFHRAIAMSGSSIGNWPIRNHQMYLAKKQAQLVGCPDTNSVEIMKCLKTKSAEELGKSLPGFREFGTDPILIWLPVIEPDVGQERFLTEDPTELFIKGKQAQVPLMTGVTADEFAAPAFAVLENATLLEELNNNFEKIAPISFIYERDTNRSIQISNALKRFYFDNKPITNNSLTALVQLYSDGVIGYGVHRLARIMSSSNNNPVFYYKFAYKGRFSHFYLPGTNNTSVFGAVHHDDLIYLLHIGKLFPLFNDTDEEIKVVEHMTTMWSNFARTGNPTPEAPELWKRFQTTTKKFLIICETLTMDEQLYSNRYIEWDKLYPLSNSHHHILESSHAIHHG